LGTQPNSTPEHILPPSTCQIYDHKQAAIAIIQVFQIDTFQQLQGLMTIPIANTSDSYQFETINCFPK